MINFAYFGSSEISITILDELSKLGLKPAVIVTTPDKQRGRGLEMTPNIVKTWALENKIPVLDPTKLDDDFLERFKKYGCEVSIVASYGKIIPEKALDAAPRKTLNIHPSLLPLYRGPSPIQTAMLDDARDTGVSIMRLDKEMDHGPIVAAEKVRFDEWQAYEQVEERLGKAGAALLAKILPDWVAGNLAEKEQDHAQATYTKKFSKEDALLDLAADPYLNFRKIQAYHRAPVAYFFKEKDGKKIRVKVTAASFKNGKLVVERIIPEGKKETAEIAAYL